MTKDEVFSTKVKPSSVQASSGSKFLGATLLYLTLALAVTFGVVAIMGGLLNLVIEKGSETALTTFGTLMSVAAIIYIPTLIWVQISAIRNGRTVGPAFFTYSLVMGLLISPLCLVVDFVTLLLALGTTCLSFAVMALIAWESKKNLSNLAVIGTGLLLGALIISLFDLVFSLIFTFDPLYWIVSFAFFIAIILLTIVDLGRVKEIAISGGAGKNVALMCALNLYVDFIYIFIRLLRFIAIVRNK